MKRRTRKAVKKQIERASRKVTAAGEALGVVTKGRGKTVARAAGIAALGAAGLVTAHALKQRRNGSAPTATTFRLEPDGEEGWVLKTDGKQDESRFENKRAALREARRVAADAQPSRLVIYRTDGRVQRTHAY
jgi:hypothetical protein